ncbi:hypothetical protein ES708_34244 [subsurface metagenome]
MPLVFSVIYPKAARASFSFPKSIPIPRKAVPALPNCTAPSPVASPTVSQNVAYSFKASALLNPACFPNSIKSSTSSRGKVTLAASIAKALNAFSSISMAAAICLDFSSIGACFLANASIAVAATAHPAPTFSQFFSMNPATLLLFAPSLFITGEALSIAFMIISRPATLFLLYHLFDFAILISIFFIDIELFAVFLISRYKKFSLCLGHILIICDKGDAYQMKV